jgi:hypothetical protein
LKIEAGNHFPFFPFPHFPVSFTQSLNHPMTQ